MVPKAFRPAFALVFVSILLSIWFTGVPACRVSASPVRDVVPGGVLEGVITNSGNEPLPFVNVIMLGTDCGTMTDKHGYFRFYAPTGERTVRVLYLGFQTQERQVLLLDGSTTTVSIALEEATHRGEIRQVIHRCWYREPEDRVFYIVTEPKTEEAKDPLLPTVTRVASLGPNPARGRVMLRFDVADQAGVDVDIFDVQGRLVWELVDEALTPGRYEREWDGRSKLGGQAATGNYYLRFRAGDVLETRKVLMLR